MAALMVLAGGIGAGLWLLAGGLWPARPPLAGLLARLDPTTPPPPTGREQGGWLLRLGRPLVQAQQAWGLPGPAIRTDLALTGRPVDVHLATKAGLALAGLLAPPTLQLLSVLGGLGWSWLMPLAGSAVLAVAGFLAPDTVVRRAATGRRVTFRHALAAYLSLVHILLAGGAGLDSALTEAVGVGQGWSFTQLSRALATARITRTTPWAALAQLGADLTLPELVELAAAAGLAGTEGAKIRTSLASKAAALRTALTLQAEKTANTATERMAVPGVLLGLGFVIFVFYPALAQVLTALHP